MSFRRQPRVITQIGQSASAAPGPPPSARAASKVEDTENNRECFLSGVTARSVFTGQPPAKPPAAQKHLREPLGPHVSQT